MPESIGGLPTHVLAVHAPVVFAPLLLILSIVFAVRPQWRRQTGFLLPGAAAVTVLSAVIAIMSGRKFDEVAGAAVDTSRHERLAYITLGFLIGVLAVTFVLSLIDRRYDGEGPDRAGQMSTVVVLALAVLATWSMVLTGDEGAGLVWKGVVG